MIPKRKGENEENQQNGKVKQAKNSSTPTPTMAHTLTIDGSLDMTVTKNISKGKWISEKCCVEMIRIKGNFWRVMGYTFQSRNYLYPEEALYLFEKNLLVIVKEQEDEDKEEVEGEKEKERDEIIYPKDVIYEMIVNIISLPCYLSYSKLKMMDYIVTRYRQECVINVTDTLLQSVTEEDQLFSFSVYGNNSSWSKKTCLQTPPAGNVVVTDSEFSFPSTITLSLLSQAKAVPVLFAIVTETGHVYIEEFTDALLTLNWNLPVGTPNTTSTSALPPQDQRDSPSMLPDTLDQTSTSPVSAVTGDKDDRIESK